MRTADIHWLAGFLEGEGYFGNPTQPLFFAADSTDRDVVERAAGILGVGLYGPYPNGVSKKGVLNKDKYRVQINGMRAAGWMMTLYGCMGDRRKARIKECLGAWRARPPFRGDRTHCVRGGHPLSGDNLYISPKGERTCRQCFSRSARRERAVGKQAAKGGNSTGLRAVSEQT